MRGPARSDELARLRSLITNSFLEADDDTFYAATAEARKLLREAGVCAPYSEGRGMQVFYKKRRK